MKELKTCAPGQGNRRKRAAFATGLGLTLLWMGPVLAAAHPMGIGFGQQQLAMTSLETTP